MLLLLALPFAAIPLARFDGTPGLTYTFKEMEDPVMGSSSYGNWTTDGNAGILSGVVTIVPRPAVSIVAVTTVVSTEQLSSGGINQYFGSKSSAQKDKATPVTGTVHVGFRLYALRDIDEHYFSANFRVFYEWCDPALAAKLHGDDADEEVRSEWIALTPEPQFVNSVQLEREEWTRAPRVTNRETGLMYTHRKYSGRFSEQQELEDFPFDIQSCKISLKLKHKAFPGARLHLLPLEIRDTPQAPGWKLLRPTVAWNKATRNSLKNWASSKIRISPSDIVEQTGEDTVASTGSSVIVEFMLKRESRYYVLNVLRNLTMLTSLGFFSFVLPVEDASDRIEIAVAMLFTLLALRFSVSVPTTQYQTVVDRYQDKCLMTLVVLAAVHSCTSGIVVRMLDPFTDDDKKVMDWIDVILGSTMVALWVVYNTHFYYVRVFWRNQYFKAIELTCDERELIDWTATWDPTGYEHAWSTEENRVTSKAKLLQLKSGESRAYAYEPVVDTVAAIPSVRE